MRPRMTVTTSPDKVAYGGALYQAQIGSYGRPTRLEAVVKMNHH